MKRLITKRQQEILMCVHHDFQGLSREEAAKKLGISSRAINKALEAVKRVLPQYFPLLTKLEIKCYHFYTGDGWKVQEIAEYMEISIDSVQNALRRAKNKGMWWPKGLGRRKSWDDLKEKYGEEWLAKITREKF